MYEIRIMTIGPSSMKIYKYLNSRNEAIEEARCLDPNLIETVFEDRIATGCFVEDGISYEVDVTAIGGEP